MAILDESSHSNLRHDRSPGQRCWTWLGQQLNSHDIATDQEDWKTYLQTYFDEMHVFFPFLHPSSVWRTLDNFWSGLLRDLLDSPYYKDYKTGQGILFLCMALR